MDSGECKEGTMKLGDSGSEKCYPVELTTVTAMHNGDDCNASSDSRRLVDVPKTFQCKAGCEASRADVNGNRLLKNATEKTLHL